MLAGLLTNTVQKNIKKEQNTTLWDICEFTVEILAIFSQFGCGGHPCDLKHARIHSINMFKLGRGFVRTKRKRMGVSFCELCFPLVTYHNCSILENKMCQYECLTFRNVVHFACPYANMSGDTGTASQFRFQGNFSCSHLKVMN